jgi:hypothetical protein
MKTFDPLAFDPVQCRKEVVAFRSAAKIVVRAHPFAGTF